MTSRSLRNARNLVITLVLTAVSVLCLQSTAIAPASAALGTVASVSPSMAQGTYASRVKHWINVRRMHHGLHRLRWQSCTQHVAHRWGKHLASTDTFYHQSMYAIMDKCNAYYAGETLGRGGISPKHLVYLWMHSPEHRAVLLSHYPRRIGIGAYPDALGEWVVAADFTKL
jgi:uncharacterized protein YkwD